MDNKTQLAPVVLFVFNRPEHTRKTVESLQKNTLSCNSDLFVFADAARNEGERSNVNAVREIVNSIEGFRTVNVQFQSENRGLAPSVIAGVDKIIGKYGKVIVIEDDLLFSPYFLEYMNEALDRYSSDNRIYSIGGYSPPLTIPEIYKDDSYLSYRCCTWGWATWRNRWENVDWDMKDYSRFINDQAQIDLFNRGGEDMTHILKQQMAGKVSSWGIRWDYAHFINDAYCFRPTFSIVGNTGNDGTGVHCGPTNKFDVSINTQHEFAFPLPGQLQLDEEINRRFAFFYDGRKRESGDSLATLTIKTSLLQRVINRVRRLIS